jgi:hypothetical protein
LRVVSLLFVFILDLMEKKNNVSPWVMSLVVYNLMNCVAGSLWRSSGSIAVGYQSFGGPCCLHLQGEGVTAQKTSAGIFAAVKVSNLALYFISLEGD